MKTLGYIAAALFIATVYAANWMIQKWGPVPVGFGLEAPAGVFAVGIAFGLRDVVDRQLGRAAVIGCIIVGAAFSYWLGAGDTIPGGHLSIALASGLAFLLSESADLAVYEPLRRKGWMPAVVASNIVGVLVDSFLFLTLAFGSLAFFWGQVVGKLWLTALAVVVIGLVARRRKVALA